LIGYNRIRHTLSDRRAGKNAEVGSATCYYPFGLAPLMVQACLLQAGVPLVTE